MIRNVKKRLDRHPGETACPPFTMRELKQAIRKMRRKGAPGADDIPPAFLKELGPKALAELLEHVVQGVPSVGVEEVTRGDRDRQWEGGECQELRHG